MSYMQSQPPASSVAFQHRPPSPETVRVGGGEANQSNESKFSLYSHTYPHSSYEPLPMYNYSNHSGGGYGGFFTSSVPASSSSPPDYYSSSYSYPPGVTAAASGEDASSSRPPPPPPSPPRTSGWDFLNPFNAFESYYPPYTPSRDSKELREEEGIPELEDDDYRQEVVKEVQGEQKLVDGDNSGNGSQLKKVEDEADGKIAAVESEGLESEVHMVDKNVVAGEESEDQPASVAASKGRGSIETSDAVEEIKAQFDRASESGKLVSKMLEVGKLPYRGKSAVYKVPSKMLDTIASPLSVVSLQPFTSKGSKSSLSTEKDGSVSLDIDDDMGMKSQNLSSTLEKLFIWEKKLYEEVKAEEKLRIIHDRKRRRLQYLDESGAEAHKVDSTQTSVRKLSTKIRIAIQVVDSVSRMISKLRDEELWPQINELIIGLDKMWKLMLECHRCQAQVIREAKNLDAVASGGKFIDVHMEVTMQLELELLNWIFNFYAWISAQKGFIKSLNGWLLKCLHYEPEETADGIAPFSPSRIGAPPVFVICNHWFQALERISDSEVFVAMETFSLTVLQLWEKYSEDQRQRMINNKDMDSKLKVLERDEQKIHRALDAVNKKLVVVSEQTGTPLPGQIVHHHNTTSAVNLQSSLKQIFEAMEKFSADSLKVYEELQIRSEEERMARENAGMS